MVTAPKIDEKWFRRLHLSATRPIFIQFWVPVGSFGNLFPIEKWLRAKKWIVHRRFRGESRHSERCSDASRCLRDAPETPLDANLALILVVLACFFWSFLATHSDTNTGL